MTNIDLANLETVTGGVSSGNSRQQRAERHRNLCMLPNPAEAKRQYEVMKSWGDKGVWKKTVDAIGKECGWR